MNIAFCKLGKSIKFKTKFSPQGGDNEAPLVLSALANNYPENTYYIVGKSDFCRLNPEEYSKYFKYNNVIDVLGKFKFKPSEDKEENSKNKDIYTQCLDEYFTETGIKIDATVMMVGQVGTVTIPNKIQQVRNHDLIASIIDMTLNYTSPTVYWLNNNLNIPVIEIINDIRYNLSQSRDIIFNPKHSLSQYDFTYKKRSIGSYENQYPLKEYQIPATYSEMEKIFLINKEFPPEENVLNKSKIFTMILNETRPSRYPELKKWILNNQNPIFKDIDIYGYWPEEIMESDSRFKGMIDISEVQEKMKETKYIFMIVPKKWITSKYIEMLYAGVLPFFHPDYDADNYLDIPDILRPKNVEELNSAIEYFEQNDSERIKLVKKLQNKYIRKQDLDGTNLSNIIINAINN